MLRPWSRNDAPFMAEASSDPAIQRYNGRHDRLGRPTPPLSTTDAVAAIDQFASDWRAFAATGAPSGVAFAILDERSGDLVGCCGVDDWTNEDVAQFGYWIAPSARGRGYATRAAILLTRWLFHLGAAYSEDRRTKRAAVRLRANDDRGGTNVAIFEGSTGRGDHEQLTIRFRPCLDPSAQHLVLTFQGADHKVHVHLPLSSRDLS